MSKVGQRLVRVKEEVSEDLANLLRSKRQILEWKTTIAKRVAHCEDVYLKETNMGNIIRGFDQDASALREKHRGQTKAEQKESDDKEKLFSGSSYPVWIERQNAARAKPSTGTTSTTQQSQGITRVASQSSIPGPPQKKPKN